MIATLLAFLLVTVAARDGDLEITAERVGPITSRTVLTTTNLAQLFPGGRIEHFETEGIGGFEDGGQGWRVWLTGKEPTLFVATDAKRRCWTVSVAGRRARTRQGLRVGSSVNELLALEAVHCRRSPEEEGELLACALLSAPNVEFLFVPTPAELKVRDAKGDIPPSFVPERGVDRAIEGILWFPPQPADCR